MKKSIGLIYGNSPQHLDHIGPLCSFLSIPLMHTEEDLSEQIKIFYPNIDTIFATPTNFSSQILDGYDVVFSCLPTQLIDPLFFFDERVKRKKILPFWIPHGQSDKDNLGALTAEKLLLVYGKQMIDILKAKNVLPSLFRYIVMGNFRKFYFESHKAHYQRLFDRHIAFEKPQETILYAPTWGDPSIQKNLSFLIENLPPTYNLMIKLHPNTLREAFSDALLEFAETKENIKVLTNFPAIFPILENTHIYLGDHSSIAYDFLSFNRPLFFLTPEQTPIHHAGMTIPIEEFYNKLKSQDVYSQARIDIYNYAFDTNVDHQKLKEEIPKAIEDYFETEVHLL